MGTRIVFELRNGNIVRGDYNLSSAENFKEMKDNWIWRRYDFLHITVQEVRRFYRTEDIIGMWLEN